MLPTRLVKTNKTCQFVSQVLTYQWVILLTYKSCEPASKNESSLRQTLPDSSTYFTRTGTQAPRPLRR